MRFEFCKLSSGVGFFLSNLSTYHNWNYITLEVHAYCFHRNQENK